MVLTDQELVVARVSPPAVERADDEEEVAAAAAGVEGEETPEVSEG